MNTFDDLQRPFPLFKAPVVHAALDGPGNCTRCNQHAGTRFHDACYDCFRTGEIDSVIDTERGMVTRDDAAAGRTHGIPLNDPSVLAGYQLTQHPVDPRFPDDRWYHVRIDSEPGRVGETKCSPPSAVGCDLRCTHPTSLNAVGEVSVESSPQADRRDVGTYVSSSSTMWALMRESLSSMAPRSALAMARPSLEP